MRDIIDYDIAKIVGDEKIDFKVKSTAPMPLRTSMGVLTFGLIMTSVMGYVFLASSCLLSPNYWKCLVSQDVFVHLIASMLLVTGVAAIVVGVKNMIKDGPLIIGTGDRLILIKETSVESIPWNQFVGDISFRMGKDRNRGTIKLKKNTGRLDSQDDGSKRFVHEMVYMVNIENAELVENLCRQRIIKGARE